MRIKHLALGAALLAAVACSPERTKQSVQTAKDKVVNTIDAVAPLGTPDDRAAQERQRFDEQWRQLQSFRQQQQQQQQAQQMAAQAELAQQQAQQAQEAASNLVFAKGKESFKNLDAAAIEAAPLVVPIHGDVRGPTVLKAQVLLDRSHFSVAALDGRWGRNSAISTWWFQRAHGLAATGDVDEATYRALAKTGGSAPTLTTYRVTADDLKGPFVHVPDDVYEKAKLNCLCYESAREELAEKFHTTEDFLGMLNPKTEWGQLKDGDSLVVPNVRGPMQSDQPDVARVVVSLAGNTLNGYDAAGTLIFHAPTTVGSKYDPSPDETVHVVEIVHTPHFHYQPTLFHEVPDTDPEAHLPPGPNSPVGVVWMALSKEHFGIHGTSDPDTIGYASSHGCVRLTNWDADELSHRLTKGVPVSFVDTKRGE